MHVTCHVVRKIAVTTVRAPALRLALFAFVTLSGLATHVPHQRAQQAMKRRTKFAVDRENVRMASVNAEVDTKVMTVAKKSALETALAMVSAKTGLANVSPVGKVFRAT